MHIIIINYYILAVLLSCDEEERTTGSAQVEFTLNYFRGKTHSFVIQIRWMVCIAHRQNNYNKHLKGR